MKNKITYLTMSDGTKYPLIFTLNVNGRNTGKVWFFRKMDGFNKSKRTKHKSIKIWTW